MKVLRLTSGNLARELLGAAPRVLRQPWLLAGLNSVGDEMRASRQERVDAVSILWDLVEGCQAGEANAIAAGNELLSTYLDITDSPIHDAAAWHALMLDRRARTSPYDGLLREIANISGENYILYDQLAEAYPFDVDPALSDADVLVCQHLLGSILTELLTIRKIIPGCRFWEILGKPYSANLVAINALEAAGFSVNVDSCELPDRGEGDGLYQLGAFSHRHREVVRASVRRFFDAMPQALLRSHVPILIIDDGGVLIDAVGNIATAIGSTRPIVCIEQTQRGLYAARTYVDRRQAPTGGFSVINVAQSMSKLVLESDLIASSVIENVFAWVNRLMHKNECAVGPNRELPIGILGYGAVGDSIAHALSSAEIQGELKYLDIPRLAVTVFDRNPNRIAAARRQGQRIAWSAEQLLGDSDIVIAATGGTGLDAHTAPYVRDGAILASASSGDMEFQGFANWEWHQVPVLEDTLEVPSFDVVHGEIRCTRPGGPNVHILNGGFPVNFNGGVDPIEPWKIQLTRTLMLAGVLQVARSREVVGAVGEFRLDEQFDRFLFQQFEALT